MKKQSTRRLTTAALLLALSVVLPAAVHLTSFAGGGKVLLPMHLPVLLGGFLLGPLGGACLGLAAPAISCLLLQMPQAALLPYTESELMAYGFMAGLLYQTLSLRKKRFGVMLSLLGAMLFGRGVYALSLTAAATLFGVENASPAAVITAVTTGALGIVIQVAVIPPTVVALERGHYFDEC